MLTPAAAGEMMSVSQMLKKVVTSVNAVHRINLMYVMFVRVSNQK